MQRVWLDPRDTALAMRFVVVVVLLFLFFESEMSETSLSNMRAARDAEPPGARMLAKLQEAKTLKLLKSKFGQKIRTSARVDFGDIAKLAVQQTPLKSVLRFKRSAQVEVEPTATTQASKVPIDWKKALSKWRALEAEPLPEIPKPAAEAPAAAEPAIKQSRVLEVPPTFSLVCSRDANLQTLLSSCNASPLEQLHLDCDSIDDSTFQTLSGAIARGTLAELHRLSVGSFIIPVEHIQGDSSTTLLAFAGMGRAHDHDRNLRCAFEIIGVMAALRHISKLDLSKTRVSEPSARLLSKALSNGSLANLQELLLRGSSIGDEGLVSLCEACVRFDRRPRPVVSLQTLEALAGEGMARAVSHRSRALARLMILDVGSCFLGDRAIRRLCEGIESGGMTPLEELHLDCNCFGDAGVENLAAACSRSRKRSLRVLALLNNQFSMAGAQKLVTTLREKQLTTTLCGELVEVPSCCNFSNRHLSDVDAYLIASSILMSGSGLPRRLHELNFSDNSITDDGIVALTELLGREAGTLRSLSLGRNPISEKGLRFLLDVLSGDEAGAQLEHLDLSWTPFDDTACLLGDDGVCLLVEILASGGFASLASLVVGQLADLPGMKMVCATRGIKLKRNAWD